MHDNSHCSVLAQASAVGDELSEHLAAMLPPLVREAADCVLLSSSTTSAANVESKEDKLRRARGDAALSAACNLVACAADDASLNECCTLLLDALRTRDTPSGLCYFEKRSGKQY